MIKCTKCGFYVCKCGNECCGAVKPQTPKSESLSPTSFDTIKHDNDDDHDVPESLINILSIYGNSNN